MGERVTIPPGDTVELTAGIRAAGPIKQIEVVKDNRFVYLATPEETSVNFVFEDTEPRQERSFYYVRVIQEDDEIAWSSPV